jgi:hypothetical protein
MEYVPLDYMAIPTDDIEYRRLSSGPDSLKHCRAFSALPLRLSGQIISAHQINGNHYFHIHCLSRFMFRAALEFLPSVK